VVFAYYTVHLHEIERFAETFVLMRQVFFTSIQPCEFSNFIRQVLTISVDWCELSCCRRWRKLS